MWKKFPRLGDVNRDSFAHDMARPRPGKQYVMYFTPRSGSSWITDIAGKTRKLGLPGEVFNPNFLPKITQSYNATTMDEYCDILKRRRNTQDVFGFQITYHQLAAVFRSETDFLKRFPSPTCFWLIRRDIVAQAVSLYKMVQTQVGHAPQLDTDEIRAREQSFTYDGPAIRHWVQHILSAEMKTEAMFARHGLTPLRMSYERNIALHPNHLVNVIGKHVGIAHMRMKPLQSGHSKIATARNDAFAAEFRNDYAGFVQEVADQRHEMLSRIDVYGPQPAARRRPARKGDAEQAAPPL